MSNVTFRRFVPPGYISSCEIGRAFARRLFPEKFAPGARPTDADVADMMSWILHRLRTLLIDGMLTAYFLEKADDGLTEREHEIEPGFWLGGEIPGQAEHIPDGAFTVGAAFTGLPQPGTATAFVMTDTADLALVRGMYPRKDGTFSPVWFRRNEVEAALIDTPATETEKPARAGRPRKSEEALSAYRAIYPSGHGAAGVSWKEAARQVSDRLGYMVSADTIKRALNSA